MRRRGRRQRRIKQRRRVTAAAAILIAAIASVFCYAASKGDGVPEPVIESPETETATPPTIGPVTAAPEPTKAETLIKSMDWDADESYILAKIAMAEAEGEDTEGKALVILVIYNRQHSGKFPDTVGGVISQENAFTSYHNGRYDRVKPDADCWAALDLIQIQGWDESQGALYFERTPEDEESTWHSRNLERLFIHGNHTFYTEKEAKAN